MQSTGPKLQCPACGNATASFGLGIELPPDNWNDEIVLACLFCADCPFQAVAVYRESRHGRLDSESFSQTGYRAPEDVCEQLKTAIANCPEPRNRGCRCPSHRMLGAQDLQGDWDWLSRSGIDTSPTFAIQSQNPPA